MNSTMSYISFMVNSIYIWNYCNVSGLNRASEINLHTQEFYTRYTKIYYLGNKFFHQINLMATVIDFHNFPEFPKVAKWAIMY